MRALFLLVMLASSMCSHAATLTPPGQHLAPAQSDLVRGMNDLRLAEGLAAVSADTVMSCLIQFALRDLESPLETIPAEEEWARRCFQGVSCWDKACFTARADSGSELLEKLLAEDGFRDALLRPDATHVVVSARDRATTGVWCLVCITRRLVELGPLRMKMHLGGSTSLTLWGRSQHREMRARFYKSQAEPDTFTGEDFWVDFEASDSGEFEVTLPVSEFGPGYYRAFVYVLEPDRGEYTIAAHAGAVVPDHGN